MPKWGTKFSEVELLAMAAALEVTREMMEQAAQGQADTLLPPELLVTPDGKGGAHWPDRRRVSNVSGRRQLAATY